MSDVSKTETRVQRRDRPVGRRASILPQRRNQEQVRTQNFGDMRSARRGDVGGAEALLRVSDKVLRAGRDYQKLDNLRWEENERELSQQGSVDVATGEVDEALAAENASYNRAVRMGQVRQALAGVLPKTKGAVDEAIAGSKGMTLEERLAAVDAAIDQTFEGTLLDEEGNVMNFGTAEATVYAANKLQTVRAQVAEDGYTRARAAMDDESIDNFANYVGEALLDGEVIDVATMDAILTPTADRDAAKAAALGSIQTYAKANPEEGVPALEGFLEDIANGEGGDLFDAQDEIAIQAILTDAMDAREQRRDEARNKRYAASAEELFDFYNAGEMTPQMIREYRDSDRISGRFARTMLSSLEADERSKRAEARAIASAARERDRHRMLQQEQIRNRQFTWDLIRASSGNSITDIGGVSDIAKGYEMQGLTLDPGQIMQLSRAAEQGAQRKREQPDYVRYSDQISEQMGVSGAFADQASPEQKFKAATALQTFDSYVNQSEMPPAMAYQRTMKDLGLGTFGDEDAEFERMAKEREAAGIE